jgi:alkylation response protein AidB-like acyl-CoA dehydrogenase
VRFAFTAEQDDLREVLRRFTADRASLAGTRARLGTAAPWDPATWTAMADDLGLLGVDLPEEHGGTGLSTVELAIAAEELGRVLWSGPFLASIGFAAGLLAEAVAAGGAPAAEDPAAEDPAGLLAAACAGRRFAAACGWTGGWSAPPRFAWDGRTVSGSERGVLHAGAAETVLVAATSPGGRVALLAVDAADTSVAEPPGIDPTRPAGTVTLDRAPARLLAADAAALLVRARRRASVALAAEALGGARRCLELATAHAKDRVQFGVPIGSFQAVKHKLADLLVEVELATSAVYLAACHVAAGDPDAGTSVPAAVQTATDTFARAARDSIQVHGGIGFTWEHDAHLYLKRSRADRLLLGSPGTQLAAFYAGTAAASSAAADPKTAAAASPPA